MFLVDLASRKQRLLQIVRILRENHQFDLPWGDAQQMHQLDEHFSGVQRQIQENSPFNSYHTDPLYAKAVLITEAVRLLFEIAPRRRRKKSVKESTNQQESSMSTLREKATKAKPDFLDFDHDGDRKESMKKALADKKKADKLDEKWGGEMHTAEKDKGMWDGWTIAELKAEKKRLMDKEERTAKEQKRVRQLTFAIRAKQENKWGKIKESAAMQTYTVTFTDEDDKTDTLEIRATSVDQARKRFKADYPAAYIEQIVPHKHKLREDETLDKAETLLAAKDISDRLQSMAEDAAKMAVDRLMPLVDTMKSQFGQPAAEGFNEVVKAQLQTVLDTIIAAKDQTDNAILSLQGGETPTAASDMSAELPAAPEGGEEPAGEEMPAAPEGGEGEEGEFNASPAASGPETEPLGRARKEPMAESRKKCMECGKGMMEAKGNRIVCNECGYSMLAEKSTKEESALAEQNQTIRALARKYKALQESFDAHRRDFAKNPNRIDPLNLGYGLEGDSIRLQLRSVRRELDEAIAHRNEIKQVIQENQNIQQVTKAKIAKLNEQAQSNTYGVLAITKNNRKVKKFFESANHRAMWLDYNKSQIQEHKLIDPQDLDQVKQRLKGTLSK